MLRTIRSWFTTPTTSKDRFVTNDKPTQTNFEKLFNSVTFVAEKADTAKLTEQGLAKKTLDGLAISKPSPSAYNDGMTRFIESHQIPDVIAEDASIVVTPVIWDATDSAIVGAVVTGHDCRRRFLIQSDPSAFNEEWKTLGAVGTMLNGEPIPDVASVHVVPGIARLRSFAKSHVEIQFIGTVNVPDGVNQRGLFVLPDIGTGPSYRPTTPIWFPVCGMLNDGSATWIGKITIDTSGNVLVVVSDPIFVADTVIDLCFCILMPID